MMLNKENVDKFISQNHSATSHMNKIQEVVNKLDTIAFVEKDNYQAYEYELLFMSQAVATMQSCYYMAKIEYDKMYRVTYKENKEQVKEVTNAKGETTIKEVTATDAEQQTKFQLMEEKEQLDLMDAQVTLSQDYLNSFKRYGDVLKSMMIADMADQKRQELAMRD